VPKRKQLKQPRRETFSDLLPLRDRMAISDALSESLTTDLERLDRVTEEMSMYSVLPKLLCTPWPGRCGGDTEATDDTAAPEANEQEASPALPHFDPEQANESADLHAEPHKQASGSPSRLSRATRSPAQRATWAAPIHRRGWDLFWLEDGFGESTHRSVSPVEKAASRARAPAAAAAAAAAVAAEAAQRIRMPVLLSRSEADRAQRHLIDACRGERSSALSRLRLRSLEKSTIRSVTRA